MITLIRTNAGNGDFINLTQKLDQELWSKYGDAQAQYDTHNKVDHTIKAVVAIEDDTPIACGAFRELNQYEIEIKRMFVHPDFRGRGISKMVLKELEKWAVEESYSKAKLETGIKQHQAISLYHKMGYSKTENYGPYKDLPESVCMGKELEDRRLESEVRSV